MKGLFVLGSGGSGKTALCVAIAMRLIDRGAKVGYFKPVGSVAGTSQRQDRDGILMKELLGMAADVETIVPFHTSPSYLSKYTSPEETQARVKECFDEVTRGLDYLIVEGTTAPQTMMALRLDAPRLSRLLGLKPLLVSKGEFDYHLDNALLHLRYLESVGADVGGVIFNNVPKQNMDKCRGVYTPILEKEGYSVLGIIPKKAELVAPTVREVAEVLGGEVLEGEKHLDRPVEETVIGAMTPESALNYFHRSINKAVVVGGDRPMIALAALETSTSVLILTGGIYPDMRVLTRAAEQKVPVLLVPHDTFTTVEKLHFVTRKIQASDSKAISQAREHLEEYCDLAKIEALLET
ncbi:MAG: phosphotransacetylase family protein [Firmicutes bacterium]|nr:phosphotransacetylase family protein [Bacillota bacterium]